MKRSSAVALSLTAMAATTLSGCAGDTPDYQAICVDPQTEQRLDDDMCDDDGNADYDGSGGGFFWFYMSTRSAAPLPAVGQSYSPTDGTYSGSKLRSQGNSYRLGGANTSGATSMKSYTKSTAKSGGFGGSGVKSYS